ncbi:peptidase inhibitor 16-like isoform X2 [Pseudophryne corroboree]
MQAPGCVLLCLLHLTSALTEEEKTILVDKHNSYRSQMDPPAAGMVMLRWDTTLEKLATSYAAKCIWEHNEERGFRGENLFVMSGSHLDVELGLDDWHREQDYYNFTTNVCQEGQMCGHYTQMVWADTERVGCGEKFCEKVEGFDEPNMHLLVCNYEPPGNFEGEKPYKPGVPCSDCLPTHTCRDSLCADEDVEQKETSTTIRDTTQSEMVPEPTQSQTEPTQSQTEPTPTQSQTEPTQSQTEPTQSQTEPTPTQSQTEPTPTQSQTEPTPTQSQTEPTQSQTESTPTQSQTQPTPTQSQMELTPTQSELVPESTQSQTEPKTTQSELVPESTQSQTEPTPTQLELVSESTPSQTASTQSQTEPTQSQTEPTPTQSELVPESTQSQMEPKTTQSELVPESTQTEVTPATTELKLAVKPTQTELLPETTESELMADTTESELMADTSQSNTEHLESNSPQDKIFTKVSTSPPKIEDSTVSMSSASSQDITTKSTRDKIFPHYRPSVSPTTERELVPPVTIIPPPLLSKRPLAEDTLTLADKDHQVEPRDDPLQAVTTAVTLGSALLPSHLKDDDKDRLETKKQPLDNDPKTTQNVQKDKTTNKQSPNSVLYPAKTHLRPNILSKALRWNLKSQTSERTYFGKHVYKPHFVQPHRVICPYPCLRAVVSPLYRTKHVSPMAGLMAAPMAAPLAGLMAAPMAGHDKPGRTVTNPLTKQLCKRFGYKRGMYSLYLPKTGSSNNIEENLAGLDKQLQRQIR